MKNQPQAERLSDEQIEDTYLYFEFDQHSPEGVDLRETYTKTMGRAWDSESATFIIL